jgi:S1-C subfamily serine protease
VTDETKKDGDSPEQEKLDDTIGTSKPEPAPTVVVVPDRTEPTGEPKAAAATAAADTAADKVESPREPNIVTAGDADDADKVESPREPNKVESPREPNKVEPAGEPKVAAADKVESPREPNVVVVPDRTEPPPRLRAESMDKPRVEAVDRPRSDTIEPIRLSSEPPHRAAGEPPHRAASEPPYRASGEPASRTSSPAIETKPTSRASREPESRASSPIIAAEPKPAPRAPGEFASRSSAPLIAGEPKPASRAPGEFASRASAPLIAGEAGEPRLEHGDDFMLADEIGNRPPSTPPQVPNPPVLPSPQEAALDAARIVSEMVDIDSESGAIIAAAAAAGAAIEAAKAAQKAAVAVGAGASASVSAGAGAGAGVGAGDDPRASQPSMRVPPGLGDMHASQGGTADPVTTVRLSRDRILAALAQEDAAAASSVEGRVRARTEPGVEGDEAYEEFDPVAIAAAAIGRLRVRARTDLAELRVHYHRHDVLVLLLAFVIIVIMGRIHERLITPPSEPFNEHGLTFSHSTAWLKPEPLPMIAPRLVRDPSGAAPTKDDNVFHVEMSAIGSNAKLEVLIDKKPAWSNIVTGLELDRRSRWGELYTLDDSSVRSIAGHDWLRTAYRYAHVAEKGDEPRVDHAVEYATIDREQIYVITIFGEPTELAQIEDVVAPSLRVQSQTGLPLVPQTGRLSQRKYPTGVGRAFDSTVMVVVADLVDGRLKARGGGSGVVVGSEGSILTNYHVLHDKDGRLHDTFVIGRFASQDRAPQLQCAGRPNRSKLLREFDLALIKCDMDLDGRTWSPSMGGVWPTLPEARAADVKMGQRLWVLGYPDVGGGGLTLGVGEVEGWTGEDGAQGKDFIKTDASITHGNSGGPVVDDNGRLVGVAAAFRTRMTASGGVIETAQVGLVRPLQSASNLLAYAAAGWTPREGYTDVELTPTAVEAAAEGVRISTLVVDDANEAPVRDATVMVLKSGVNTSTIDMNRLDDQAIAWGKTNALGEVRLKQLVPVPGTYTVMVIAPGYEPLIGENELHLDEKTPPSFDPWGKIGLRSR